MRRVAGPALVLLLSGVAAFALLRGGGEPEGPAGRGEEAPGGVEAHPASPGLAAAPAPPSPAEPEDPGPSARAISVDPPGPHDLRVSETTRIVMTIERAPESPPR